MGTKLRRYTSDDIDVTYDVVRCIHVAECVRGLPTVFDRNKRPWVQPAQADADTVAEVVLRCPTGALHFEPKDGGDEEPIPLQNSVVPAPNGPLYIRGNFTVRLPNGNVLTDTRVALCRCGASEQKPFCDNSHLAIRFQDLGHVSPNHEPARPEHTLLTIQPTRNGPLWLQGDVEIVGAGGEQIFRGTEATLCRCGGSSNKPFCDGTHLEIGFIG